MGTKYHHIVSFYKSRHLKGIQSPQMEIEIKQERIDGGECDLRSAYDVSLIKEEELEIEYDPGDLSFEQSREEAFAFGKIKTEEFDVEKTGRDHEKTVHSEPEIHGQAGITERNSSATSKLEPNSKIREKVFACDQCAYKGIQKSHLVTHKLSHSKERPFSCSQCVFKCKSKSNLANHRLIHTGEKTFSCDQCNYKCVRKSYLMTHKLAHSQEKPFSCDLCAYRCKQKSNLTSHKLTHSVQKSLSCGQCAFSCFQKRDLISHKQLHSSEKNHVL